MTEPQKSEASASLKEQIARKELEYFKHRYKLHERQIKELDDIIELLIRQREAEAEKRGRIDENDKYLTAAAFSGDRNDTIKLSTLHKIYSNRLRQLKGE